MSLATAERVANSLAWMLYEQQQEEAEAIEQLEVLKYEEIISDAELMHEAMTHLYLSSDENQRLVENMNHALDLATCGKDMAKIFEAAQGIADMRDRAAAMYAEHLVSRGSVN